MDDETKPHTLRGLMEMKYLGEPIPLEEVESEDSIVKRFKTGAMSYGSISREAHECLAQAMNLLGGKSNSGEGGEEDDRLGDPERYSAIKQVASGRFGVTSAYLVSAREIHIEMGQGAKPGEGGHLPAGKVYPWDRSVLPLHPRRHPDLRPTTTFYSIEDRRDPSNYLKCANRQARISVKLVSEAGAGTIAARVAKAGAQVIPSPATTEAPARPLVPPSTTPVCPGSWVWRRPTRTDRNGLRSHVVLESDGKLMSGRDVAIACMLGA